MPTTFFDLSVSLDGYVAGPDQSMQDPLGIGGEQLHEWALAATAWRERHGLQGGEDSVDSRVIAETIADTGAGIMGRKMFSGGSGPWEGDANGRGWWGEDPPFHHPVYVLTHHRRAPLEMEGGTTFHFVTDGIESALEQARAAAGERAVQIHGGAQAARQYLAAGHVDHFRLHVAPVLLGSGERLFDGLGPARFERTGVEASPSGVAHLYYRVRTA